MLRRLMLSGTVKRPLAVITFIPVSYRAGSSSFSYVYTGAVPGKHGTLSPSTFTINGITYSFEWIRERVTASYPSDFRLAQGGSLSYKNIVMRINGVDYTVKANAGTDSSSPRIGFKEGQTYIIEIFDIV